jgi:hypothetical protein
MELLILSPAHQFTQVGARTHVQLIILEVRKLISNRNKAGTLTFEMGDTAAMLI